MTSEKTALHRLKDISVFAKVLGVSVFLASQAVGHGNVTPQPVDTDALPDVGEDWLEENPYRSADEAVWLKAVEVGSSGFNQNCARCHGLGAVSGGIAPDLRYLEANIDGDEWYLERFQHGYTQEGITKMPAFGELLGQKAAWAIRTYVETRPEDGAMDPFAPRLKEIRDDLLAKSKAIDAGSATAADFLAETTTYIKELNAISAQVVTASGAERADSIAREAVLALDGRDSSFLSASETLTVGLSAAE
ncbi:cytochrome c-550 PedF [Pseudogemmobacter sp. W21_MBD1_M6]|uniref:cytochrome c-550 PedF n=1 Tax=Pseudogemmobacter sp. W21_MBD1_M6 TaxID=3240271 RepID=UPI003F9A820E